MNEFYKCETSNEFAIISTRNENWIKTPCFRFTFDGLKRSIRKTGPHGVAEKQNGEVVVDDKRYIRVYSALLEEVKDAVIDYFLDNNDSWLFFTRHLGGN